MIFCSGVRWTGAGEDCEGCEMKRKGAGRFVCMTVAVALLSGTVVFANTGERGYTGGITQGISLPKTTEQMLTTTKKSAKQTLEYSEMIFLTGKPVRFDGLIDVTPGLEFKDMSELGSYNSATRVRMNANSVEGAPEIDRDLSFKVNYRKVTDSGSDQVILDYNVTRWDETIVVDGQSFVLDEDKSYYGRSIIKDITPGVSYYKGQTSQVAYYYNDAGEEIRMESSGTIYGYDSPWSKTETERLNVTIITPTWQMETQVRPTVSVNKVIQYSPNEPTAISFDGNYYEVTKNQSALSYNIYNIPPEFAREVEASGSISIPNINKFEMLPAPDLAFLKGHFAESDIKKVFAMQIFDGNPSNFQPAQAMTRAQFVAGLVKAFKVPVDEKLLPSTTTGKTSSKKKTTEATTILFPDVRSNREDFAYLMAAYNSGIVVGRFNASNDNHFRPDEAITMEEAIVMLVRGLGLENLGLEPTTVTPFADDQSIANWAKKEVSAAYKIGVVDMDANGNLNPKKKLTKAEGAAMINRVIDYMRVDLPIDYVEHILNFAD